MDNKKLKRNLREIGRDIAVAFIIVAVIMLSLYAYCGIWPPMVVIESGSMEHPPDDFTRISYVGIIDTGDMVFVKKVNGVDDVITYVQGEGTDYSKYGSYGDVVVYRPNGLEYLGSGTPVVPIIHRLVVCLELNSSQISPDFDGIDYANYSFDVPSLEICGSVGTINITNYGYQNDTVQINLGWGFAGILQHYENRGIVPHGGYITMGDNNAPSYDQPAYEPVLPEWIIGKAWGELPWFGLIKLWATGAPLGMVAQNSWTGLFVSIMLLISLPILLDFVFPVIVKLLKKKDKPGPEGEGVIGSGPEEDTPEEIDPGKEDVLKPVDSELEGDISEENPVVASPEADDREKL